MFRMFSGVTSEGLMFLLQLRRTHSWFDVCIFRTSTPPPLHPQIATAEGLHVFIVGGHWELFVHLETKCNGPDQQLEVDSSERSSSFEILWAWKQNWLVRGGGCMCVGDALCGGGELVSLCDGSTWQQSDRCRDSQVPHHCSVAADLPVARRQHGRPERLWDN